MRDSETELFSQPKAHRTRGARMTCSCWLGSQSLGIAREPREMVHQSVRTILLLARATQEWRSRALYQRPVSQCHWKASAILGSVLRLH